MTNKESIRVAGELFDEEVDKKVQEGLTLKAKDQNELTAEQRKLLACCKQGKEALQELILRNKRRRGKQTTGTRVNANPRQTKRLCSTMTMMPVTRRRVPSL